MQEIKNSELEIRVEAEGRLYGATKALVRISYLVLHVTGNLERVVSRE